jgi:hypothetical protein
MNTQDLSVTLPVEQALATTRRILFQPFDLGKWFVIGFCAFLAYLGEGGGGGGTGFNPGGDHQGARSVSEGFHHARDYVVANLYWIIPVAAVVAFVVLGIWLLIAWLSSRGKFMFLHCVALNRGEVAIPWRKYEAQGNSLFLFRFIVGLLAVVPFVALVAVAAVLGIGLASGTEPAVGAIVAVIVAVLGVLLLALLYWVFTRVLNDFIVPIMYLRRMRCLEAWRMALPLIRTSLAGILLYLLFRILLAIATGAVVIAFVLITCCVAGCLMAIPYIGTVLLLPVLVFERSYALHFLSQFGVDYDVFQSSLPGEAL